MNIAECRKQIKILEKDFDVEWLVKGWNIRCRHCRKGWFADKKFGVGSVLHLLNHLYSHKDSR